MGTMARNGLIFNLPSEINTVKAHEMTLESFLVQNSNSFFKYKVRTIIEHLKLPII